MKHLMTNRKGEFFVFTSTLSFGAMGVLARGIYQYDFPVLSTLFIRFFIASLSMALYMKATGLSFHVTKEEGKLLVFLGLLGYANFSLLYFTGVKYTGAAIVALVFSGFPVFVAILSRFVYKKPVGKKKGFFLFTSLVALFFLTGKQNVNVNLLGVFFSLAGSFFYAIYTMFLEDQRVKNIHPVTASFYIIFLTTLALGVLTLAKAYPLTPPNLPVLWRLVVLGVFSTSVAILTFYLGVQYLGAVKAAIISNFEAVVSVFLAILFLGEQLTILQWAGAILMILSVVAVTILKE